MAARAVSPHSSPVNMADIDTITSPPRPLPHQSASRGDCVLESPFPSAARVEVSATFLEDVISSLDASTHADTRKTPPRKSTFQRTHVTRQERSPSCMPTTSASSPSSAESTPAAPPKPQTHRGDASLPSADVLYMHRRHLSQRGTKEVGHAPRDSHRPPPQNQVSASHQSTASDPLLGRIEEKERQFDEKVQEIDRTFHHVGRQLVVRDDIIERLQRELERLRGEMRAVATASAEGASHAAAASSPPIVAARHRDWHQREQAMVDQLSQLAQSLKAERDAARQAHDGTVEELQQLRAALKAKQTEVTQQQAQVTRLLAEQDASRHTLREQKRQFRQQLTSLRDEHQKELVKLEKHFRQLEDRCSRAEQERHELAQAGSATQAQLLALRLNADHERQHDDALHQRLLNERQQLQEEVEAVHLSLARLLQVMEQVPILKDYLRWNEQQHQFVFLGYPTRYFTGKSEHGAEDESAPPDDHSRSAQSPRRRKANREDVSPPLSYLDASTQSRSWGQTGVEDGVYGGTASAQETKNVWLNGNWASALQSIIHAENRYLRLKRIKLYEMEEAAQLSEQLPNARDVLACRQQESDYWVPFAVFEEAQRFKNKYCPRVPAVSHFFPFLVRLNRIWNRRVQERVSALKKQLRSCQRQLRHANTKYTRLTSGRASSAVRDALNRSAGAVAHNDTSRASFWGREPVSPAIFVSTSSSAIRKAITAAEEEHYRLRRDVRLNVVSPGSLHLFRLYDALVKQVLDSTKDAVAALKESDLSYREVDEMDAGLQRALGSRAVRPERESSRRAPYGPPLAGSDDSSGEDEDMDRYTLPPHVRAGDAVSERVTPNPTPTPPTLPVDPDVSHLRERVAAVGDHLLAQTLACSQDLLEIFATLRDRVERGADVAASTPELKDGAHTSGRIHAAASDEASTGSDVNSPSHVLQQRIRELLREQYGESDVVRSRTATPTKAGATPVRPTLRAAASSVAEQTLPHVMDTALDYSNEVRQIVLEAYEALQRIAHTQKASY